VIAASEIGMKQNSGDPQVHRSAIYNAACPIGRKVERADEASLAVEVRDAQRALN